MGLRERLSHSNFRSVCLTAFASNTEQPLDSTNILISLLIFWLNALSVWNCCTCFFGISFVILVPKKFYVTLFYSMQNQTLFVETLFYFCKSLKGISYFFRRYPGRGLALAGWGVHSPSEPYKKYTIPMGPIQGKKGTPKNAYPIQPIKKLVPITPCIY